MQLKAMMMTTTRTRRKTRENDDDDDEEDYWYRALKNNNKNNEKKSNDDANANIATGRLQLASLGLRKIPESLSSSFVVGVGKIQILDVSGNVFRDAVRFFRLQTMHPNIRKATRNVTTRCYRTCGA